MQTIGENYIVGDTVKVESDSGYVLPAQISQVSQEGANPTEYFVEFADSSQEGFWCTTWDFLK